MIRDTKTQKPARPVLRYHGGKWLLAKWIISHFPPHRTYVEPFGGAASVLIQKPRTYSEVYNDLDGEIVNLFRVLRDRGAELRDKLLMTPFAREEYKLSFQLTSDEVERARRTVVRSYQGFGSNALCSAIKSGFRANGNRSGTTPAHDWANYPACMDFLIDRLRAVVIESRPAVNIIRQQDGPKTLHYCDPPYVPKTRCARKAGRYGYNHEMDDQDHRLLAEVLHSVKGMVILSGYACDLYDCELYADWYRVERKSFADGARKRTEVLWMNRAAARMVPQQSLFT